MMFSLYPNQQDEVVSIFKEWLNEILIPSPNLPKNNLFCERTRDAVVRFQLLNKISPSLGVIDPETAEEIQTKIKKKNPHRVAQVKRRSPKLKQIIDKAVPKLSASGELTVEALAWLAPNLKRNKIPASPQAVVDAINLSMQEAHANTPARKAAFLSQVIHESDGLNTTTEYATGEKYENNKNLRNTEPGDGRRFKGRGFIQLTGRANYTDAWLDLGFAVKRDKTQSICTLKWIRLTRHVPPGFLSRL